MDLRITKVVFVILSVFLIKISIADPMRTDIDNRNPAAINVKVSQ